MTINRPTRLCASITGYELHSRSRDELPEWRYRWWSPSLAKIRAAGAALRARHGGETAILGCNRRSPVVIVEHVAAIEVQGMLFGVTP